MDPWVAQGRGPYTPAYIARLGQLEELLVRRDQLEAWLRPVVGWTRALAIFLKDLGFHEMCTRL